MPIPFRLPDVPSPIVPPGCKRPSASGILDHFTAILSLTELPGLKVSTLASTKALTSAVTYSILLMAYIPMVPNIFSA
jgi:hypothetical protein